jgi:hypothetical protein
MDACDSRLDVYIYDYLVKRNMHNTAKAFMTEGKVATDPVGTHASYTSSSSSSLD